MHFKAIHEGTNTYLRLTDQDGNMLIGEDGGPVLDNVGATVAENELSISNKNEPGAALPNTGGPCTGLIYLLGFMLMAFAGAGLIMKRKAVSAA